MHGTTQATNALLTRDGGADRADHHGRARGRAQHRAGLLEDRRPDRARPRALLPAGQAEADRAAQADPRRQRADRPRRRRGRARCPTTRSSPRSRALVAAGVEAIAVSFLWSFVNDAHERRIKAAARRARARRVRVDLARGRAGARRVRAHRDHRDQRLRRPEGRRLPGAARRQAARGRARASRCWSCRPAAASPRWSTRPAADRHARLRPDRRHPRLPVPGQPLRRDQRDLHRRRRHLVRRRADPGRRDPARPRSRSSPSTTCGCRRSWSTRSAPAAAASPGSTRAACCASGRRAPGRGPGPACYGLGGAEPTVTDADLVLGYLDAGAFLGGRMPLDRDLALKALARAGRHPGHGARGGRRRRLHDHQRPDGGPDPQADDRAGPRSARVHPRRLRRRRARPTPSFYGSDIGSHGDPGAGPARRCSRRRGCSPATSPTPPTSAGPGCRRWPTTTSGRSARHWTPSRRGCAGQFAGRGNASRRDQLRAQPGCPLPQPGADAARCRWPTARSAPTWRRPCPRSSPGATRRSTARARCWPAAGSRSTCTAWSAPAPSAGRRSRPGRRRAPRRRRRASAPCTSAGPGSWPPQVFDGAALQSGHVIAGPAIIERMGDTVVLPPGYQAAVDPYLSLRLTRRSRRRPDRGRHSSRHGPDGAGPVTAPQVEAADQAGAPGTQGRHRAPSTRSPSRSSGTGCGRSTTTRRGWRRGWPARRSSTTATTSTPPW